MSRALWGDWYRRLFAAGLARGLRRYTDAVDPRKRQLFSALTGEVVEIGPGPGTNLRYLSAGVRWTGVDPNVHMAKYVERESVRRGVPARLITGTAAALPFADGSVDAVISSLVLCSVTDVPQVLREIRRVLKPGGRFIFIEHVAAPAGTGRRRVQRAIKPLWSLLGDGCEPDRETWKALEEAGFQSIQMDHFRAPLPIATPHIAGTAIR